MTSAHIGVATENTGDIILLHPFFQVGRQEYSFVLPPSGICKKVNTGYVTHNKIAALRVYGKSAHLHLKFAQNFVVKLDAEFCNL